MAANPSTAVVPLRTPPFPAWTYDAVRQLVDDAVKDWYEENESFAEEGDYWRDGEGWIGPTGDVTVRQTILDRIEPQFTPVDAIGDALDNVENALLKREPRLDLVLREALPEPKGEEPTPAEITQRETLDAETEQLKAWISTWWDERSFHELLKLCVRRARWGERSYLRLWIPPGEAVVSGEGEAQRTMIPTAADLQQALAKVYAESIPADRALIYIDPDTQKRASIVLWTKPAANGVAAQDFAEVAWVDGEDTVIRTLAKVSASAPGEMRFKMGGRLPLVECRMSLLITEAVRSLQKRLNYFETVLVRNVETAGFPERVTINAEDEGEWVAVPDGEDPGPYATQTFNGVVYKLMPVPRTMGAAITTNLRGIPTGAKDNQTLTTPSAERFEPVDPELTTKACHHAYRTLMRSCKQAHLANDAAAEASGVAYEQARAAFVDDLFNSKGPLEGLTRDTISALLALSEHITGKPALYTSRFRVAAEVYVNAGPESPDALRLAMDAGGKGFLSRENVMGRLGVEDPQAEISRIAAESEDSVTLHDAVAAVMVKLEQAGVLTPDVAAAMMQSAGMPVEDAEKLATEIRAAQAPPAGTPGSGLGTGGVPPIPGISG